METPLPTPSPRPASGTHSPQATDNYTGPDAAAPSFFSPLGLRDRVPMPDMRMDAIPLVTVLLLAVVLSLAGSQSVYLPGLIVGRDATAAQDKRLELPRSTLPPAPGAMAQATLTLTAMPEMVLFNGVLFDWAADAKFEQTLTRAAADARAALQAEAQKTGQPQKPVTILMLLHRSLTWEQVSKLSDFATKAGFEQVIFGRENSAPQSR